MAKLKNVTPEELNAVQSNDIIHQMQELNNRLEKGYCDDLPDPIAVARHFTALAREASSLVSAVLFQNARQIQQAELDALRKKVG